MSSPNRQFRNAAIALSLTATLAVSCGQLFLGSGGSQNDPVPSGTVVAQGNFGGMNGRSVTGTVSVYLQNSGASNCTYVVRFQGLSAPTDSGLLVVPLVNGAPSLTPSQSPLSNPAGNENYYFTSTSCSVTWVQVQITNPGALPASAQAYGMALLQAI